MSAQVRQITNVLLRAAADLGHGGALSEYRIDAENGTYRVTMKISRNFPSPGESTFKRSELAEILIRDNRRVERFLGKLSEEFDVFALGGLEPSHPFLHPTFYSFSFQDSSGAAHSFQYSIECSRHLDKRYERLIRTFDGFFESKRIFDKFYAQEQPGESEQKSWWKFW